jgi:CelD/BcsL family acetyltransferase involved in cellulose biosynthesis
MVEKLKVSISNINSEELEELKKQWLTLEASAKNSIFTSWQWISTWLAYIDYSANLLTVQFNNKLVGLAFVKTCCQTKNGLSANQLWLNRTGDDSLDQIWSEYNDILCEKGLEYSIRSAVLSYYEQNLAHIDELVIGVSNRSISETPISNNLMQYTSWKTNSYATYLKPDYAHWSKYLHSLSKNTRNQIKRSAKLFGGIENISISRAESSKQAKEFFNAAGEFHKLRWVNQNSGFENKNFVNFHHQFIDDNYALGSIDIIRVHIGEKTICYLYNLIYKETVYFYLSGIEYKNDNRYKPGLLSHSLAISYYADKGFKKYDFMGGEGRYKNSLSNKKSAMIISNFRRKKLPFLTSHLLREAKKVTLNLFKNI